jgi:hypothetical protein
MLTFENGGMPHFQEALESHFQAAGRKCLNLRETAIFTCSQPFPRQGGTARQVNIANVRTFLK